MSSIDYPKFAREKGIKIPEDFWKFWSYYFNSSTDKQKELEDSFPYYQEYNKLLMKINNLIEMESKKSI